MITTNISFNYINAIKITLAFLLTAFIFKSIIKPPSVIIEFLLLALLLVFSLFYAAQKFKVQTGESLIFVFFLIYLLLHTLFATFIRPLLIDVDFFTVLQFLVLGPKFQFGKIFFFSGSSPFKIQICPSE